ncbi:universal stress protein [Desulfofustis glycolicus]|uniref:Universal stress protein n=1 Tax=Desulfofustis glycolicus DSM 9705 TaxID=1121409 RepID=A0A1M5UAT9_9BACT|nr:universal stress protein [Desulfofustis glycolicus]MCB2214550.1 universal stress protein [Desulfobulbaceae bacterium]SHH60114.1 Nucleotide-binding universal stress protein, UspA family [Desulfofustis glycolicus DSM 9705]
MLPEFKTILYATDLGKHTRPVFRTAISLARRYEADITMLHVVEPMSSAAQAIVETYLTDVDAKKIFQDNMRLVLKTMKSRLEKFCQEEEQSRDRQDIRVKELLVISGRPSEEIIKAAQKHQADLIVMGKSTRRIFGTDIVGSTARRVPRYATIPVIIVPNN